MSVWQRAVSILAVFAVVMLVVHFFTGIGLPWRGSVWVGLGTAVLFSVLDGIRRWWCLPPSIPPAYLWLTQSCSGLAQQQVPRSCVGNQ
jgi:hypothetical protein